MELSNALVLVFNRLMQKLRQVYFCKSLQDPGRPISCMKRVLVNLLKDYGSRDIGYEKNVGRPIWDMKRTLADI